MKILVSDNFKFLDLIKKFGETDLAIDGYQIIEKYEKSLKDQDFYDMICLNKDMPYLDEYSTYRVLREIEYDLGVDNIKIIIYSDEIERLEDENVFLYTKENEDSINSVFMQ